jgi:hypothetical protein
MRPADVKTFRRTKTVAFSRTKVLSIPKTFCLNKFNNISVDSISGITFRFTFSVSPPLLGTGQRAVWPTQLQLGQKNSLKLDKNSINFKDILLNQIQ